jgi:hypothetical protein
MRGISEQASALLATDVPQERAALELLHRKRSILLASRARLRATMNGIIARAVIDIGRYGDEVAEVIEPGKSEKDVEVLHASAQGRAHERSDKLSNEARQCIETELKELRRQLDALSNGVLARELTGQVEIGVTSGVVLGDSASPAWDARSTGDAPSDWHAKGKKAGNVAKGIGNWAGRWATGPAAADGASVFGTAAARGSDAHKAVYNVGKFFGVKFQPWGAVKVARTIGNAGRVIAAVGGVLAVVAQIAEDIQQEQYRLQLRDARDGVRSAYRDSAFSVQVAFSDQFESFLADFYDSELLAIEEIVEDFVGKRSKRKSGADAFQSLEQRASKLIDQITTKRLEAPAV